MFIYIALFLVALAIMLVFLMRRFLKKCLKRLNWPFSSDINQVHQPVALENISNDLELKHTDLKLEDVSSFDKKDEKDDKIDLNFEHIASDINTAKESKASESPKDQPQKIDIEFSRVEDVSKIMGTEA